MFVNIFKKMRKPQTNTPIVKLKTAYDYKRNANYGWMEKIFHGIGRTKRNRDRGKETMKWSRNSTKVIRKIEQITIIIYSDWNNTQNGGRKVTVEIIKYMNVEAE